ncbi:MAG TPA: hypothetical protein VJZ26_15510 [Blastocatellia bacterium]|nr:hypothetical protein [Blastocatellia bacterium]
MKLILTTLKKVLFWSYERGSWQYDVMCVLILAFIFFAPNNFFYSYRSSAAETEIARPLVITSEEVGPIEPGRMKQDISAWLSRKAGRDVSVSRVERVTDDAGAVKYLAYEE